MDTPDRVMNSWQLFCFSMLSAPLAMVSFAVVSFVPTFYAADMGLGLAAVGAVFMFGRFFDVFTDPLIGTLSDRISTRWGPRLPWMALAFPGLLLFAWLLLSPPEAAGPVYLFCAASGYLLFLTLFDVPYSSIGLEISPNGHERSVLAGAKAVLQILGALIASLAPLIIGAGMGLALNTIALGFLIAMPVAFAAFLVWAPRQHRPAPKNRPALWAAWRNCLRQHRFRKLMCAFFTVQAANAMTVGLLVLFATHVVQAPELVGQMFLMLLLATALFVPFWIFLSARVGKRQTWIAANTLCCLILLTAYTIGAGDTFLTQALCAGLGACMTCDAVMPTSILADIASADETEAGHPRAASYLALKNAASKMAFVAPMGIAFPVLGLAGFDKTGANGPETMSYLLFFFAGLPFLLRLAVSGYLLRNRSDWNTAVSTA